MILMRICLLIRTSLPFNLQRKIHLKEFVTSCNTKCVTDLDYQIEMIIFGSILTTFESRCILEAAGAVLIIGSSLKPNHHWEILLAQIRESLCMLVVYL
jgi:hypothetical protein